MKASRAVILPVVLMILLLLGLLVAMFSFRVHADLSSTQANVFRVQTRLAAEAGIDRVRQLLRIARFDTPTWYHNPELFHRVVVWAADGDESVIGTNEDRFADGAMVYRFSIIADDPTDDEYYVRFGITDEASKLNINTTTPEQLAAMVRTVVAGREDVDPQALVDAIIDWRDTNTTPRGDQADTEGEYYKQLPKPYRVKNGPFDTVEELLLVKGISGQILFGEDWDRNGLLTANEDDGEQTFPLDNQDGVLNPGLFPYLTTISLENNVSNDNRPRVSLQQAPEKMRAELQTVFPDDPELVEYIVSAAKPASPTGGGGPKKPPTTPPPATPKKPGKQGPGITRQPGSGPPRPLTNPTGKPQGAPKRRLTDDEQPQTGQPQDPPPEEGAGEPEEIGKQPEGEENPEETGDQGEKPPTGGGGAAKPILSPASLLLPRTVQGQEQPSPLSVADLPRLMDRLTAKKSDEKTVKGLVSVNTAPPLVLFCLLDQAGMPLLTEEQVLAIVQMRTGLDSNTLSTTAWLVTEGVMDVATFEKLAPSITARGQQFTIESLGYADHIGMVTRLQVVVDMVGPIAQTIYYRDLTYLGAHYPIREEDLEQQRVR